MCKLNYSHILQWVAINELNGFNGAAYKDDDMVLKTMNTWSYKNMNTEQRTE